MKKLFLMLTLFLFAVSLQTLMADDLDDLDSLEDEAGTIEAVFIDEALSADEDEAPEQESNITVSFGGYLKTLAYWNQEKYSDLMWTRQFGVLGASGYTIPQDQQVEGYNNIGTRMQLKVEGFLGDSARLFTAININMNSAAGLHDSSADARSQSELRMVESFIEIFNGSRTWKIGPQMVTWSFIEGMEVPTDRVNAKDNAYKSTEYEDSKMASNGILLTQSIFDSALEVMFIPVANVNVDPQFKDFFYPGAEQKNALKLDNGKWATRFTSSIGKLDYAFSYVNGPDREADLYFIDAIQATNPLTGSPYTASLITGKTYNMIQSPGIDLQYNFGNWLAKLSYVIYQTEDSAGKDPYVKNSWSKYVVGGEFTVFGNSINLYTGQHVIDNFSNEGMNQLTNFLLGQMRETTSFVSGHLNANFLTGDALNLVLMSAGYWDEKGEPVQSIVKATFKYKVANGLEVLASPMYMDLMDNIFADYQLEVKYSF